MLLIAFLSQLSALKPHYLTICSPVEFQPGIAGGGGGDDDAETV